MDLPPSGYRRIRISIDKGREGRAVFRLDPAGSLLTREILDAEFHAERELPIPPDSWLQGNVKYRDVIVPGAPASCEISALFRNQAAVQVRLSRDPL